MKLIENASKWWKMFSIQAMTLAGAIQMAWLAMPEDLKSSIPSDMVQWVTFTLLILGAAGRLIKQDSVEPK